MPVTSWCKKWAGQERECDRCPGLSYMVYGIVMNCDCKCHKKEEK